MYTINIKTKKNTEFIDITEEIRDLTVKSGIKSGLCTVFVPHTTAGITINENADPDVMADIIKELSKIVPFDDNYLHTEGNSAAHLKAYLTGVCLNLIIEDRAPVLGTWQGIYFCEFDGPRNRKIIVKFI